MATTRASSDRWDIRFDEVAVDEVLRAPASALMLGQRRPGPRKAGSRPITCCARRRRRGPSASAPTSSIERLLDGGFKDPAERLNLERELMAALTRGCERGVDRLPAAARVLQRRLLQRHREHRRSTRNRVSTRPSSCARSSSRISPGTAGCASASTSARNRSLEPGRRLHRRGRAAWCGRSVGDDAFLPVPYNSRWAHNRAEVRARRRASARRANPSASPPMPWCRERRHRPARPRRRRQGRDGQSRLPRLGLGLPGRQRDGAGRSPLPLRACVPLGRGRRRPARPSIPRLPPRPGCCASGSRACGCCAWRNASSRSPISPSAIARPIVEVYLNGLSADERRECADRAALELGALARAGADGGRRRARHRRLLAKRGHAARRPLARPGARPGAARDELARLIAEFAKRGYRPAALEGLVSAEAATARWQALDKFAASQRPPARDQRPLPARSYYAAGLRLRRHPRFHLSGGPRHLRSLRLPGPRHRHPHRARSSSAFFISADVEIAREGAARPPHHAPAADARPAARDLSDPARGPLCHRRRATARSRPPAAPSWEADGRFAAPLPAGLSAWQLHGSSLLSSSTATASIRRSAASTFED